MISTDFERIKRLPFVSILYRLFYPAYGTCGCCGLPWSSCESHTVTMDRYGGFFAVCEYCWNNRSLEEIKAATEEMWRKNLRIGGRLDWPLGEMLKMVEISYRRSKTRERN